MKQKIGDFNITGESEMEFIFRTFLRTAFITSVLNGQVSRKGRTIGQFRILKVAPEQELGPVSRKSRKLFGPEKPFVKLRPAYSVKLVFSYVVKGIKIKLTAKFRASIRLRFEDTKRIMSPEVRPKKFGTFEKQAPGLE